MKPAPVRKAGDGHGSPSARGGKACLHDVLPCAL